MFSPHNVTIIRISRDRPNPERILGRTSLHIPRLYNDGTSTCRTPFVLLKFKRCECAEYPNEFSRKVPLFSRDCANFLYFFVRRRLASLRSNAFTRTPFSFFRRNPLVTDTKRTDSVVSAIKSGFPTKGIVPIRFSNIHRITLYSLRIIVIETASSREDLPESLVTSKDKTATG